MADTYAVVAADIAAELKSLFPSGFGPMTVPTAAQVASMIQAADLAVTIAIQNASGAIPSSTDRVAPLARRVIIDRVKAQVLRIVYAGLAPAEIETAAAPYETAARMALASITELTTQAAGVGDSPNRVLSSSTIPERDLLVCDSDLGPRGATRGHY